MIFNKQVIVSLIVLTLIASQALLANPISQADAENAVDGWLKSDEAPLGASLGRQIAWTDSYSDANGLCVYYVVYLDPSGFVIVAADDLIEPIIGFVTGLAYYDPSSENTLGAIVSRDLPSRAGTAKILQHEINAGVPDSRLTPRQAALKNRALRSRSKWTRLHDTRRAAAYSAIPTATDPVLAAHTLGISDMRVAPLLTSKWGQDTVNGQYCYNYYTPGHYYDGCVATAMAQFMRYRQWPTAGIGANTSGIYVSGVSQNATTRGGDGLGGPYNWSHMTLGPNAYITTAQREAIGALCYDAGVAAHMQYASGGSGAYMSDAKNALVTTFKYSSAVHGGNGSSNIGAGLNDMINPNLDSGNPVILAAWQSPSGAGHAFVADGYGYNSSTLYHHLNLGWNGYEDAWYNLPNIDDASYAFNVVDACIYNIYTSGAGEIISGRITNSSGQPFAGAVVTAQGPGGPFTATSAASGVYALVKVQSNATYTITVTAPNSYFTGRTITTGRSLDYQSTCGNKSGIDFVTSSAQPAAPSAPAVLNYPTASSTGQYTVSWSAVSSAASYELTRSGDGGISWTQLYAGAGTSYAETVTSGSYSYCVRAVNGGGASDWASGAWYCAVDTTLPAAPASITYPAASSTGKYTVSWPVSSGAASYVLKRSQNAGITWTQIYSGANTSYSETIGNGNYRYSVSAVNGAGSTAFKAGSTDCIVRIPPPLPASITYPSVTSIGRYTVKWSASAGATSYQLERSADGGTTWSQVYSSAGTSYYESVASGVYRYRVKAAAAGVSSAWQTGTGQCTVPTSRYTRSYILARRAYL